jgi:hypothetical protein
LENVLVGDNGHILLSDFAYSIQAKTDDDNLACDIWTDVDGAIHSQFPAPEVSAPRKGRHANLTAQWDGRKKH